MSRDHAVCRFARPLRRISRRGDRTFTLEADEADALPIDISDVENADLDEALKATVLGEGIRAVAFIPLVSDGALIGKFMGYFREPYAFTKDDLAVSLAIARQLAFSIQRNRTHRQLRDREAELAEELAATRLLQSLSVELAHEVDVEALYEKILDAAKTIMRSDFASMQQYFPHLGARGELKLLGFRGFSPEAAKFWTWVRADSSCTCGVALATRQRVIAAGRGEVSVSGGNLRSGVLSGNRHPRGSIDPVAFATRRAGRNDLNALEGRSRAFRSRSAAARYPGATGRRSHRAQNPGRRIAAARRTAAHADTVADRRSMAGPRPMAPSRSFNRPGKTTPGSPGTRMRDTAGSTRSMPTIAAQFRHPGPRPVSQHSLMNIAPGSGMRRAGSIGRS